MPLSDQLLAFLSLAGLLALILALKRKSTLLHFSAGLLVGLASFISLGSLAIALVMLVVMVGWWLYLGTARRQALRGAVALAAGAASLWVVYWLVWSVPPWQIAATAMDQHYQLVTSDRQYGIWLGFNLVDFLLFAGVGVVVGFVGALLGVYNDFARAQDDQESRQHKTRRAASWLTAAGSLALGLILLAMLLLLSGATRGEVGRLWLFFMPLLAVSAGLFWSGWLNNWRQVLFIAGLQLALAISIGVAWQPVEAVIVVAEKPTTVAPDGEPVALDATFEQGITLAGYWLAEDNLAAGDALQLSVIWRSMGPTNVPYTVFAHVVDGEGMLIAQKDSWPIAGQWPPTCWRAGESIYDPIQIDIPGNVRPGDYQLVVGLYDSATGQRLPLLDGLDSVRLTDIQVLADG